MNKKADYIHRIEELFADGQLTLGKATELIAELEDMCYEPATVLSGIAGGYINAQTGKPVEEDGKVLDNNGWRKE